MEIKSLHFTLLGLKCSAESRIYDIRKAIGDVTLCKTDKEKMLLNRINEINQSLCVTGCALECGCEDDEIDEVRKRVRLLIEDPDYAGNPDVYPYKVF